MKSLIILSHFSSSLKDLKSSFNCTETLLVPLKLFCFSPNNKLFFEEGFNFEPEIIKDGSFKSLLFSKALIISLFSVGL